jgi:hypothetical protein
MKASMKSVMKNSMNKIMKESDLEYKNFLPKILCGAKNFGVCGSKKIPKNDRFVVTATIECFRRKSSQHHFRIFPAANFFSVLCLRSAT